MNEVDTRKGDIVIGATLVLTGLAIVLDRAGVFHWRDQWTLWPLILGGIGLARLLQSIPGEPKQGLLFLTAAVWLFIGEAGWVSLEDSWPIVIIAFGLIVALNGGRRRRWRIAASALADPRRIRRTSDGCVAPDHPLSPLAILGIWIAIVVALQVSGIRSFRDADANADDRVRVVSVMGRSEHISRATAFQGADVTNVMGRSELDLRDATVAPGANATVHVFSAMGAVVLRVPPNVDGRCRRGLGARRQCATSARAPAPRRMPPPVRRRGSCFAGLVMFGRLTITS